MTEPQKLDRMKMSTEEAIASGYLPDVKEGSLWRLKSSQNILGRIYLASQPAARKRADLASQIAMLYDVEYEKLKATPYSTTPTWAIHFSLLIGEELVEDLFLWHDEWKDCMEKIDYD